MSDWANGTAEIIYSKICTYLNYPPPKAYNSADVAKYDSKDQLDAACMRFIADDLRKANAQGMREAANHCGNPDYAPSADRWELANCFDNEADLIEMGKPL